MEVEDLILLGILITTVVYAFYTERRISHLYERCDNLTEAIFILEDASNHCIDLIKLNRKSIDSLNTITHVTKQSVEDALDQLESIIDSINDTSETTPSSGDADVESDHA